MCPNACFLRLYHISHKPLEDNVGFSAHLNPIIYKWGIFRIIFLKFVICINGLLHIRYVNLAWLIIVTCLAGELEAQSVCTL